MAVPTGSKTMIKSFTLKYCRIYVLFSNLKFDPTLAVLILPVAPPDSPAILTP
jgi:hypothetical protein